ncbi:hypothetical protein BCF11_4876 [Collimonas sp. PA-H2]|uniref:hypothetical protein n=1 Tax=Collimonas sp. PA-H2 TaxID=1881062 RepID=UPI000BF9CB0D|nr:hypothetical protein [Collimonas sp. PA-H2]PFH12395.1 hypothetical protein BCF11_4876 [Collimonas sp. PA-H2]
MFEDLIKKLNTLKSISVPVEGDAKGYIDKQCPSKDCEFLFKVHTDDWTNIFKDEAVWCPMCRHEAPSNQWHSIAQVNHAREQALKVVRGEIHNALVSGAEKFNRQQSRNGFVSISMKVTGGRVQTSVIPAQAAEEMQLEVRCEVCSSRYAVIGSAFFCPSCGHNSVTRNYSDALNKIQVKRDNLEIVRRALIDHVGKDEAEVTCRSILETCISDGVVAFQKFCEGLYADFGTAPFNAFQRIDHGSKLWEAAIGHGYGDWLDSNELKRLMVLYQKRHLLAHNDGVVDSQYMKKSGDTTYKEGQRIVVSEKDVSEILASLNKLGTSLKAICGKS